MVQYNSGFFWVECLTTDNCYYYQRIYPKPCTVCWHRWYTTDNMFFVHRKIEREMENEIRFTFYMQFSFDFLSIEIFKFFRSLRILDWLQKLQNLNSSLDGLDILKSRFFLRHTWHEITVCDQLFSSSSTASLNPEPRRRCYPAGFYSPTTSVLLMLVSWFLHLWAEPCVSATIG